MVDCQAPRALSSPPLPPSELVRASSNPTALRSGSPTGQAREITAPSRTRVRLSRRPCCWCGPTPHRSPRRSPPPPSRSFLAPSTPITLSGAALSRSGPFARPEEKGGLTIFVDVRLGHLVRSRLVFGVPRLLGLLLLPLLLGARGGGRVGRGEVVERRSGGDGRNCCRGDEDRLPVSREEARGRRRSGCHRCGSGENGTKKWMTRVRQLSRQVSRVFQRTFHTSTGVTPGARLKNQKENFWK